jgi:hypothetical protein
MIVSAGYNAYPAVVLTYGQTANLNLNMTSPVDYDRFRLAFAGLPEPVQFVVEVTDNTNYYADSVAAASAPSRRLIRPPPRWTFLRRVSVLLLVETRSIGATSSTSYCCGHQRKQWHG